MKNFHSTIETFHDAILNKDTSQALPAIKPNPRIPPEQQLSIYIDGYRLRLIEAIRSDYPALLLYLGESEFDRLALRYIETTPPTHFNLDRYPHAFAATLQNDDFAIDLAQLEAAIARVFMREESKPLTSGALLGITPETLAEMILTPRTASELLTLNYPADTYMEDMREGKAHVKPQTEPRHLFLVRHGNEVKRHVLSAPEYLILSRLAAGMNVGDALESVIEERPEYMSDMPEILQTAFARWIAGGFFKE